jgi:hypothetical protein
MIKGTVTDKEPPFLWSEYLEIAGVRLGRIIWFLSGTSRGVAKNDAVFAERIQYRRIFSAGPQRCSDLSSRSIRDERKRDIAYKIGCKLPENYCKQNAYSQPNH